MFETQNGAGLHTHTDFSDITVNMNCHGIKTELVSRREKQKSRIETMVERTCIRQKNISVHYGGWDHWQLFSCYICMLSVHTMACSPEWRIRIINFAEPKSNIAGACEVDWRSSILADGEGLAHWLCLQAFIHIWEKQ